MKYTYFFSYPSTSLNPTIAGISQNFIPETIPSNMAPYWNISNMFVWHFNLNL